MPSTTIKGKAKIVCGANKCAGFKLQCKPKLSFAGKDLSLDCTAANLQRDFAITLPPWAQEWPRGLGAQSFAPHNKRPFHYYVLYGNYPWYPTLLVIFVAWPSVSAKAWINFISTYPIWSIAHVGAIFSTILVYWWNFPAWQSQWEMLNPKWNEKALDLCGITAIGNTAICLGRLPFTPL